MLISSAACSTACQAPQDDGCCSPNGSKVAHKEKRLEQHTQASCALGQLAERPVCAGSGGASDPASANSSLLHC